MEKKPHRSFSNLRLLAAHDKQNYHPTSSGGQHFPQRTQDIKITPFINSTLSLTGMSLLQRAQACSPPQLAFALLSRH
jgi:hypothetical protein